MFGWLKKNGAAPAAMPEERRALLEADLRRLDAVAAGLGGRALRHALEGDDAAILDVLAASSGGGSRLELKCVNPSAGWQSAREAFFRGLPAQPPSFYLRLALIYEAASRRERGNVSIQLVPGGPVWLEIFLWEASNLRPNTWGGRPAAHIGHELVEQMLALAGQSPDAPLRALLFADPKDFRTRHAIDLLGAMEGMAAAAARHAHVVAEALGQTDAKCRVHVLDALGRHGADPTPHLARIVDLAVASAKTVRASAQALVLRAPDAAAPLVRRKAAEGDPEERAHAVGLVSGLQAEDARAFLEERLASETAPRVAKAIEELLGRAAADEAAPALDLPPLAADDGPPLSRSVRDALGTLAREWWRKAHAMVEQQRALNRRWNTADPPVPSEEHLDRIFSFLQAGGPQAEWPGRSDGHFRLAPADAHAFLEHPELRLVHAVRFLAAIGTIEGGERSLHQGALADRALRHFGRVRSLSFGLREVGAAMASIGLDPALLGWSRLDESAVWARAFDWEADAVWPYFAERPEMLEEALGLRPSPDAADAPWRRAPRRTNALAVLESFPSVPSLLLPKLWELALGPAKTDRAAAQRCLQKTPDHVPRIVAALADGAQAVRSLAAEWLADLGQVAAVPALEAALRKEKQDAAKAALMDALERLGAPVDRFLDRPGLEAEARKGLRKGVPLTLAWLDTNRLPAVRWADTGETAPPEVVTWLVVQAHKLGSPEPSALLRRYAHQMRADDREALGRFVLEAWIAADVRLPTEPEVQAQAQQRAQQIHHWYAGRTLQQVVDEVAAGLRNQPQGSLVAAKGALAVAGACAGSAAATPTERYLKTWYGYRAAQCRALLQMLSWVDHPLAIQLVLGTATRFRTAGIRKEAERQAGLVAERKGWSVAELADRTLPTAGFDAHGELELDYGARRFVARLDDDFGISLATAEGKAVAALPEPRGEDSAEEAASAKKTLANARKELKVALKMQRERLYEAMCTQRAWTFADWDAYLHRHPIAGRHCRQLVWTGSVGDGPALTFRPIGDGSLTDAGDGAVSLPADATVRIAHACHVPEDLARAWSGHLSAYEVEPLFPQLARAVYRPAPEALAGTRVGDCEGHLVRAFKLRARATKLGYVRGAAEDGGWFFVYRKHFPTLGLDAVVEFTGNGLPEEDRTVALRALSFTRAGSADALYAREGECVLGEVPPVLLTECWNDLRTIAAEGTGFDPEWEKKVAP